MTYRARKGALCLVLHYVAAWGNYHFTTKALDEHSTFTCTVASDGKKIGLYISHGVFSLSLYMEFLFLKKKYQS